MSIDVDAAELDLARYVRRGDRIVLGQACGEPTALVAAVMDQGRRVGDLSAFIATSFSGLFTPENADLLNLSSMGAMGALRGMAKAASLDILPVHVSQIAPLITVGTIPCDVAMIQVSPADAEGNHSFGLISDYVRAAVDAARVVIAEVNDQVPFTYGESLASGKIDVAVHVSRSPVEVGATAIGAVDEAIAGHAARYIGDGSVIQTGIGSVPDAILRLLRDRRDLGVHSGMIGDGVVELIEAGVVTNSRKKIDPGVSISGALIGSRRLYDWAHRNASIRMCATTHTHDAGALAQLDRLVTINSAIEVDLTGQVNAEQSGGTYLGGTGGQVDFARAGALSRGGRSLIALSSTAKGGAVSKIVAALSGPVTTGRSDVDVIVTEFGAAELRGRSLRERARQMVELAHPDFREELDRAAYLIWQRGY